MGHMGANESPWSPWGPKPAAGQPPACRPALPLNLVTYILARAMVFLNVLDCSDNFYNGCMFVTRTLYSYQRTEGLRARVVFMRPALLHGRQYKNLARS